MAHKYGATEIPIQLVSEDEDFPPERAAGDPLLGYLADFLKTVITRYCGDAWEQVQPGKPIIRTVHCDEPDSGFKEQDLPALYVYRPPRETREIIESFDDVADDYRFQHGRVVAVWIHDANPQEWRRVRNSIIDGVRKCVDACIRLGRDSSWVHPKDLELIGSPAAPRDPKAEAWGSSVCNWAGATIIELKNSAPGKYEHRMLKPAPMRTYEQLRFSFEIEERFVPDIGINTEPHETIRHQIVSPDQGTTLGDYLLGEDILDD